MEEQPTLREILAILHKWGIHTLGQLASLDKEELRARLGAEAVRLWEQANGTSTRLLKLVRPSESFDENFEFDHEIETAQPLLFILRRFLDQLALRLSAIYLVAQELSLRISFSGPQTNASAARSYERVFKIPQPTNETDLLFRMLQTHLENFKSEYPIVAVGLKAKPVRPASQQFGLFETALRNPQQLCETLACLNALLGSDRVGTPVLEETHRPDAFRMEPFNWTVESAVPSGKNCEPEFDENALRTGHSAARPALRRFRPPANATVFISQYKHLQSDRICGEIVDQAGPYLLSGNWWDEKFWTRAEWDLQLDDGNLIRIHESDPPSQNASPARTYGVAGGNWKIDGIYD